MNFEQEVIRPAGRDHGGISFGNAGNFTAASVCLCDMRIGAGEDQRPQRIADLKDKRLAGRNRNLFRIGLWLCAEAADIIFLSPGDHRRVFRFRDKHDTGLGNRILSRNPVGSECVCSDFRNGTGKDKGQRVIVILPSQEGKGIVSDHLNPFRNHHGIRGSDGIRGDQRLSVLGEKQSVFQNHPFREAYLRPVSSEGSRMQGADRSRHLNLECLGIPRKCIGIDLCDRSAQLCRLQRAVIRQKMLRQNGDTAADHDGTQRKVFGKRLLAKRCHTVGNDELCACVIFIIGTAQTGGSDLPETLGKNDLLQRTPSCGKGFFSDHFGAFPYGIGSPSRTSRSGKKDGASLFCPIDRILLIAPELRATIRKPDRGKLIVGKKRFLNGGKAGGKIQSDRFFLR